MSKMTSKDSKMEHLDVDKQHDKVLRKIKNLAKTIRKMGGEREVFHRLFSLARYAGVHFMEEEKLMFVSGYRKYQDHKQQHAEFIRKIGEMKSAYHSDRTSPSLPMVTQDTLGEWLKNHIKNEDEEFKVWLNSQTRKSRSIMNEV
ncbi:MAG: bacteriohemerythrin [Magnetococcus sp. YQC-3]